MLAATFFLVITLVSASIGFIIYRLVRHRSAWLAVPLSIFGALFTVVIALIGYLSILSYYPPNDQEDWKALSSVTILVDREKREPDIYQRFQTIKSKGLLRTYGGIKSGEGKSFAPRRLNMSDIDITADYAITLSYPESTKTSDDSTVALNVASESTALPDELQAVLRVSESVRAWTSQYCPSSAAPAVPACIDDAARSADFVWVVSSNSGGLRQIAIEFPDLWSGKEWTAIMPYRCGDDFCARRFGASSTSYASADGTLSIDLSRRVIRVPISISTTLGISSEAYVWLTALGVVLSGALGSGWLFTIVELVRTRSEMPKKTKSG